MVAQAVASMKPVGALMFTSQRFLGTHINGSLRTAEFRSVERIPRRLLHTDIPGHYCDRANVHIRRAQRHD